MLIVAMVAIDVDCVQKLYEVLGAANRDIGPPIDADKDMRKSRMIELIPAKAAESTGYREEGLAVGP